MSTDGTAKSSIEEELDAAEPRPSIEDKSTEKKNYAERLSRALATKFAHALRRDFDGILPDEDGSRQESRSRTARGLKKLDVNYSTPELGLGLAVSIKTLNYRDRKASRYTKNYSRIDNELRAEALDYHLRQPYAVMTAVVFLPFDSCDDARSQESSFGAAVKYFHLRGGRKNPKNQEELFEKVWVGLYEHEGEARGRVAFFDVETPPPKQGRPSRESLLSFSDVVAAIKLAYDERNKPPFHWA